jgi:Heavy metal binding domain
MDQRTDEKLVYLCPMHSGVRQSYPGKCPSCGMELVREGTRFVLLRHMVRKPLHLVIMTTVMVIAMAAAMMMLMR